MTLSINGQDLPGEIDIEIETGRELQTGAK